MDNKDILVSYLESFDNKIKTEIFQEDINTFFNVSILIFEMNNSKENAVIKNKTAHIMNSLVISYEFENESIKKDIKNMLSYISDDYPMFLSSNFVNDSKKYVQTVIKSNSLEDNTKLSKDQKELYDLIINEKSYSFSMPTSFGKSFLILKFAKFFHKMKHIFIIVPTISLMNEYRRKFYENGIPSTSNPEQIKYGLVYILTQERIVNIDIPVNNSILIIDEAYEISKLDKRSMIAIKKIQEALSKKIPVKMFSPNVENPRNLLPLKLRGFFEEKCFYNSLYSRDLNVIKGNENISKKIIKSLKNNPSMQTIILSKKSNVYKFASFISNNYDQTLNLKDNLLYQFLEKIYTNNFIPLNFLLKGICISNGDMPKLFRAVTEVLFRSNKSNLMVANTTITKGVNLNAKKIIMTSSNLVSHKIKDEFELRNAIGRVGRYDENWENRIGKIDIINKSYFDEIKKINSLPCIDVKFIDVISNDDRESKNIKKIFDEDDLNPNNFKPNSIENYLYGTEDVLMLKKYILSKKDIITKYLNYKYNTKEKTQEISEIEINDLSNSKNETINLLNNIWTVFEEIDKNNGMLETTVSQIWNNFYKLDNGKQEIKKSFLQILKSQFIDNSLGYDLMKISKRKYEYFKNENYYINIENLHFNKDEYKLTKSEKNRRNIIKLFKEAKKEAFSGVVLFVTKIDNVLISNKIQSIDGLFASVLDVEIFSETEFDKIADELGLPAEFAKFFEENKLDTKEDAQENDVIKEMLQSSIK